MSIFSDMKDKLLEDKKEGVKMHFSVYVYYGHCSTYRVTRQVSQKLGEVLLLGHNNIHFPIKTIFAAKFSVFLDGALENLYFIRLDATHKIKD